MRLPAILLAVSLIAGGCSSGTPDADGDGTWVGTITTEGNATTVVNESGSVWDGRARLVEEASIGSETAGEEYLFSYIMSVTSNVYAADGTLEDSWVALGVACCAWTMGVR